MKNLDSRGLRIGLAVTVAVLVAVLLAGVTVRRSANAAWSELREWADRATQEWAQRDFRREALWGETRPGSAFGAYAPGLDLAAELVRRDQDLLIKVFHQRDDQFTPEDAAALRKRWAPCVAALREGAHRRDARRPVDFTKGFSGSAANLVACRWVVNLAVIEAREHLAAGRDREAVELLLDAATFGADLVGSPLLIDQMIGVALVAIATGEAWTDESLQLLDRETLDFLADGLARLDARMPVVLSLEGEVLVMAHAFLEGALGDWDPGGAWKYGFSSRWMMASAVRSMLDAVAEMGRQRHLPWSRRHAMLDRQGEKLAGAYNPLLPACGANLWSAETTLRHGAVRVRLLRLAVDHHRGAPSTELRDPLGDGPLQRHEEADRVRFASQGLQGKLPVQRLAAKR